MTPNKYRALIEQATPGPWYDAGHKIGAGNSGIAEVEFDEDADKTLAITSSNLAPHFLALWEAVKGGIAAMRRGDDEACGRYERQVFDALAALGAVK